MNQVEGHIKIGEAIQAMWKDTLGVDVQIQPTEWRVYLELLNEDPPQIWRLGWSLDYPDANNFLNEVFRSTSTNNHTLWVSEAFDKLVDDAAIESDTAKRTEMYAEAEEILVKEDAVMIPIYWYAGENVTKPYVAPVFRAGEPDLYMWDVNK
jgi:oligopeptide transport system substrate-binding protein